MPRLVRWLVMLFSAILAASVLALLVGYAATRGPRSVPRTVVDDPTLPQATFDGVRLHVETFGRPENPPVIVIHGGPGNDFRYLLPLAALADRYFVVFYDQRGSGLSERVGDERLSLDGFYRELDAVVDRYAGGRKVRIVGHSWGAMLASGYLGQHPEKVAAIVLAEPGMLTEETATRLMQVTHGMRPPFGFGVAKIAARRWLESLHVDGPDRDARDDWFMGTLLMSPMPGHPTAPYYCGTDLRNAKLEGWRFGARVPRALFRDARRADGSWKVDFVRGVERFTGRVLILAGSCDAVLGVEQQRLHMKHFPRAQLVVIEGAGHTMFGEKPRESVEAVRAYFAERTLQ